MAVTIREFITSWAFNVDFATLKAMDARIGEIKRETTALGQNIKQVGRGMREVGGQLTTRVTLPVLALGGASANMSANFDDAFSRIVGLVGVAREEVEGMRGQVLDLAGRTSRAPQELADALFFVTSAGLRGQAAMDVLEASAKAATAGLGDTANVADLVTSAVNAYGPAVLSAGQATDILVAAVREGKAEAPELAASLGQVLPIASEMGVTFDQVGAAVAAMTRTGTGAQTAAIQLRQILASLLNPTNQAKDALEAVGLSASGVRSQVREQGLIATLQTLKANFEGNEEATAQVFGNIRALAGVLDILGGNAEENIAIFDRMADSSGALAFAFGEASDQAKFDFGQAITDLRRAMIDLGKSAEPLFRGLARFVSSAANAFIDLNPTVKTFLLSVAGLAAVLGPLLITLGIFSISLVSIAQAASVAKTAILGVRSAIMFMQVAAALGNQTLLAFIGSMLAAVAVPALLVAAIVLLVDEIVGMFTGKRTFFGDVVGDWIWRNITLPVIKGIEEAIEFIEKVPSRIAGGLRDAFGAAAEFFGFGDASVSGVAGVTPSSSPAAGVSGANQNQSIQTNNISVSVPAMPGATESDQRQFGRVLADEISRELDRRDRQLAESFPEPG